MASSRLLPTVFNIELLARASFFLWYKLGGHTTNAVGVIS
jgi:hypothetical protein